MQSWLGAGCVCKVLIWGVILDGRMIRGCLKIAAEGNNPVQVGTDQEFGSRPQPAKKLQRRFGRLDHDGCRQHAPHLHAGLQPDS